MNHENLFNLIISTKYEKHGKDVDYTIIKDDLFCRIYVLFLGSNSKQDWKSNLNFWPKPVKPYKNMGKKWYAHKGFVEAYQSVHRELLEAIDKEKRAYPSYRVVIAGHSFGGAIAQLCYEDCISNLACIRSFFDIECQTFGSPRVIYSKWKRKELYNRVLIYNFENGSDVVPKLPPFAGVVAKEHIGERFCLFKCFTSDYHMGYGDPEVYQP